MWPLFKKRYRTSLACENTATIWFNNLTSEHTHKIESRCLNEYVLTHIHSNTTDTTQEAKEPKCPSTNKWIHKMCCEYNSRLFTSKPKRDQSQNIQPETKDTGKRKGKLLHRFSATITTCKIFWKCISLQCKCTVQYYPKTTLPKITQKGLIHLKILKYFMGMLQLSILTLFQFQYLYPWVRIMYFSIWEQNNAQSQI